MTEGKGFDVEKTLKQAKDAYEKSRDNDEVVKIPLDKICPKPGQPRKIFDEKKLKELADSIAEKGVLLPIIVRKNPDPESPQIYVLIAGERRCRAAMMAGEEKIRAIISEQDDLSADEIALIENVHRENLTFYETMMAVVDLKDKHASIEITSRKTGIKPRTIEEYCRFHKRIKADDDISQIFEAQMQDIDFTTAFRYSSVAEQIISLKKRDKREFDRILARMVKKGVRAAVDSFIEKSKKKNTNIPAERAAPIYIKETDSEAHLTIKIKKGQPLNTEERENIVGSIREFTSIIEALPNIQEDSEAA